MEVKWKFFSCHSLQSLYLQYVIYYLIPSLHETKFGYVARRFPMPDLTKYHALYTLNVVWR